MWAAHDVRARLVDVRRETAGADTAPVATLTLQPTSSWRGHRAGQYVQVGVDLPGSAKRLTRCSSSAASVPGEPVHPRRSGPTTRARSGSSWSTTRSPARCSA